MLSTYSWNTVKEITRGGAYAALYLDNREREAGPTDGEPGTEPIVFSRTSRRLIDIFDMRYREQSRNLGEEVWTLRPSDRGTYAILVKTCFWRKTDSKLVPFDFTDCQESGTIEMGLNELETMIQYLEGVIGLKLRVGDD